MNTIIDNMTLNDARDSLHAIADVFGIGRAARDRMTILTNAQNANRRAECLGRVEAVHTTVKVDEDGEYDECPLRWGATPDEYENTYRALIKPNNSMSGAAKPRNAPCAGSA